jgi:hypothetical protein
MEEIIKENSIQKKHVPWRKKLMYVGEEEIKNFKSDHLKDYDLVMFFPKKLEHIDLKKKEDYDEKKHHNCLIHLTDFCLWWDLPIYGNQNPNVQFQYEHNFRVLCQQYRYHLDKFMDYIPFSPINFIYLDKYDLHKIKNISICTYANDHILDKIRGFGYCDSKYENVPHIPNTFDKKYVYFINICVLPNIEYWKKTKGINIKFILEYTDEKDVKHEDTIEIYTCHY